METPKAATMVPSLVEQLTPTSKKRNYNGEFVSHAPNSLTPPLDEKNSAENQDYSRTASPALSRASTPLTDLGPTPSISPQKEDMAADSKKRKLTFAEREVEKAVKKREKEDKEKIKADAKAKKDEEKKRKDDEKEAARKVKKAQKEEKQKAKDAAQQEKDAEKQRKQAEVLKKERVGLFFQSTHSTLLTRVGTTSYRFFLWTTSFGLDAAHNPR